MLGRVLPSCVTEDSAGTGVIEYVYDGNSPIGSHSDMVNDSHNVKNGGDGNNNYKRLSDHFFHKNYPDFHASKTSLHNNMQAMNDKSSKSPKSKRNPNLGGEAKKMDGNQNVTKPRSASHSSYSMAEYSNPESEAKRMQDYKRKKQFSKKRLNSYNSISNKLKPLERDPEQLRHLMQDINIHKSEKESHFYLPESDWIHKRKDTSRMKARIKRKPLYHSANDILEEHSDSNSTEMSGYDYSRKSKGKKRRRKTYSSLEDMLDWDMHSESSDNDMPENVKKETWGKSPLRIQHRQYSAPANYAQHPDVLEMNDAFSTTENEDESISFNEQNMMRLPQAMRRFCSENQSGTIQNNRHNKQLNSSTSSKLGTAPSFAHYRSASVNSYRYPERSKGDGTYDSVFSLNHFGHSNSLYSLRGGFMNRSNFSESSFGLRSLFGGSRQALSDVLIKKEDFKPLSHLTSGSNYVVCSGCMTFHNEGAASYLHPVCLQIFQGLNNNADRLNLLHNVAELRYLQHPNILQVFGACVDGERSRSFRSDNSQSLPVSEVVMVTEWTHHHVTLHRLLIWCDDVNPLLLTEHCIIGFALQICSGVSYLETQDIIHNNLTTSTVMLDPNCTIKLSGIEPHSIKQRTTPYRWVAIESYNGFSSFESVVWSVAVVIWSMKMYGERPYSHLKTSDEILSYLSQGKRLDRPSNCSKLLYDWMSACWRQEPSERPALRQIINFLQNYSQTIPVSKAPKDLFPNMENLWSLPRRR